MSNLFDHLRDKAFDISTNTMGYPAIWLPANGEPEQNAQVLYNDDTDKYEINSMAYDEKIWRMEYRHPYFKGLKKSVDSGVNEKISIELNTGCKQFHVRKVDTKFDGITYVAYLQPLPEL